MRKYHLLAALLAAALLGGCGGGSSLGGQQGASTEAMADTGLGGRIEIPAAPPGAGIETYRNETFGLGIQFPLTDFALFDPPQYVTVLNNRVFELVHRVLPEGQIFRPNVGMIVDARFPEADVAGYTENAPAILGGFFEDFQVVADSFVTIDGTQARALEFTATWRAPDGTGVALHRITLFTKNRGNFLIFTFTAPPPVFEAHRPAFQAMINSIDLF